MLKTFKFDGVKVAISKEKLQNMLDEYDKPKWGLRLLDGLTHNNQIWLTEDGVLKQVVLEGTGISALIDFQNLSATLANMMDDRLSTKEKLDNDVVGYNISTVVNFNKKTYGGFPTFEALVTTGISKHTTIIARKHFKNNCVAMEAALMIEGSHALKTWLVNVKKKAAL